METAQSFSDQRNSGKDRPCFCSIKTRWSKKVLYN